MNPRYIRSVMFEGGAMSDFDVRMEAPELLPKAETADYYFAMREREVKLVEAVENGDRDALRKGLDALNPDLRETMMATIVAMNGRRRRVDPSLPDIQLWTTHAKETEIAVGLSIRDEGEKDYTHLYTDCRFRPPETWLHRLLGL